MKLKIAEARRAKKEPWSQRKLASKAKVSRSYLSEVENGKYIPSIKFMCKISKALGCTIDELVDCEDE
jgi:putative transcriptional regulator